MPLSARELIRLLPHDGLDLEAPVVVASSSTGGDVALAPRRGRGIEDVRRAGCVLWIATRDRGPERPGLNLTL
jgi:hypothetical protein